MQICAVSVSLGASDGSSAGARGTPASDSKQRYVSVKLPSKPGGRRVCERSGARRAWRGAGCAARVQGAVSWRWAAGCEMSRNTRGAGLAAACSRGGVPTKPGVLVCSSNNRGCQGAVLLGYVLVQAGSITSGDLMTGMEWIPPYTEYHHSASIIHHRLLVATWAVAN